MVILSIVNYFVRGEEQYTGLVVYVRQGIEPVDGRKEYRLLQSVWKL